MRACLAKEADIADKLPDIEKALPGVNAQFDRTNALIVENVGPAKKEDLQTVANMAAEAAVHRFAGALVSREHQLGHIHRQLAAEHDSRAAALEGMQDDSMAPGEVSPVGGSLETSALPASQEPEGFGCEMRTLIGGKRLAEIYAEYYGDGDYRDVPMGGIFALEQKYKTKWRKVGKHYSPAEDKQLGRVRKVMEAIKTRIEAGEDYLLVLDDLDEVCGPSCNLAGLVSHCQENGWIEKRAARKRKAAALAE